MQSNIGMTQSELADAVLELKEEKNVVILAHNYQVPEVQDIADYVGIGFSVYTSLHLFHRR